MTAKEIAPQAAPASAPPTPEEIDALKRLVDGVIRAQGNRFIKELLRKKNIQIGDTKEDFKANLDGAINKGNLRLEEVDEWLKSVEGWGNQHVYLYNLSPTLRKNLTIAKIRERVRAHGDLEKVWEAPTVLEFPDEPKLTSISYIDSVLRLVWHEASPTWIELPDKNYIEQEGIDTIEYRAFLKIERRIITRFEAHPSYGLAALFVPTPVDEREHQTAINEARRVIGLLLDLPALLRGQCEISVVSRNLDQQNLPNNRTPNPPVKTQKSRLTSGAAYVEFAATSTNKAFWESQAVRNVRNSVRTPQQLLAFKGTEGSFIFQEEIGLTRPLRAQLYGEGNRVRLWAQMDAEEVWTILRKIETYQ